MQVDFDPTQTNYTNLLQLFWENHDATSRNKAQYMSAIFFHDEEQRELAEQTMLEHQKKVPRPITTKILPAETFYDAEDYHQKYLLRRHWKIFQSLNLSDPQVITSHVATRLNGYINGHGQMADLLNEIGAWKLNEKQEEMIRDAVANVRCVGGSCSSCYFDGVNGELANLFFTTVPLTVILLTNIILYLLTWRRIKQEEPKFKGINGREARIVRASHRAARTMTLFVTAFIIQWWAMCIYGIVQMLVEVPIELFQFVTTFSNVGGILNGIVYYIIRRRSREKHSEASLELSKSDGSKKFTRMTNSNSPTLDGISSGQEEVEESSTKL
uniref:peptide-methionine (S)-S-oxide reductase n=1 Tax=Clytia hemisphaerica TaxID=252671 RepID=A0A7M5UNR8_9CNID